MPTDSCLQNDPKSKSDWEEEPEISESRSIADQVSFGEGLRFWLKLGFISFGGPAGQIAIMHRELVERRRWISEDRFLHALNYCMLLPGPEAQQLATYVGWLLHRIPGGIVAGGLFVLPSIFVLLALSYLYAAHGNSLVAASLLYGLRPVVVAIVFEAVLRIGRRAVRKRLHIAISAAAFVAIYFLGIPFPWIVVLAGLLGWLGSRLGLDRESQAKAPLEARIGSARAIDDDSPAAAHTVPSWRRFIAILLTGVAVWLAGWAALAAWGGADSLHAREYFFFTKAALVTFGGAYAVLSYVSQASVSTFGWLTHAQTVDGLALAETTPGPLIMVVQFVGFMAAWNHPAEGLSPLASGVLGGLLTTFVTFLPSFLFIFLGAPYIEVLRSNRALNGALRGVTASVVGVVLNLALVFAAAVVFPRGGVDWWTASMAAGAFLALWRFRAGMLWVMLGGALLGFLRQWGWGAG